jgi:serine/threonine-protein kinase
MPAGVRVLQAVVVTLFFVILCGAGLLARHNLRLGRGDRRGALRLAGFGFLTMMASWVTRTHHVPVLGDEFNGFLTALAECLLLGGMLWLVYVALEPYVRRRWPGRIIGWNRLLAGDWRDPLVGRDVLLGAFFGCLLMMTAYAQILAPRWLGLPPVMPQPVNLRGLFGVQYVPVLMASQVLNSLLYSATIMLLLLLLTLVTRRERVAVALLGLALAPLFFGSGNLALDLVVGGLVSSVTLFVLLRFGMLALVFMEFFLLFFNFYPVTAELTAWYAGASAFAAALGVALILYGLKTSLAGQPLFRTSLLND